MKKFSKFKTILMNLITETYYLIFRKMSRNPKSKYFLAWFHVNGVIAFYMSTVKHFKRKNYRMIFVNIRAMFWQAGETVLAWFTALQDEEE